MLLIYIRCTCDDCNDIRAERWTDLMKSLNLLTPNFEAVLPSFHLVVYTFAIGSITDTPEAVYNISFNIHTLKLMTE